jgi:hypothetical protein
VTILLDSAVVGCPATKKKTIPKAIAVNQRKLTQGGIWSIYLQLAIDASVQTDYFDFLSGTKVYA